MAILKSCISSPIQAGPSLLDSQCLPPQLNEAFEYISARLIRKRIHLSLIIVPGGTQLPLAPTSAPLEPQTQTLPTHTSFFSRALSPIQCISPASPRSPLTPSSPLSPLSPRSPRSLFSSHFSLFTQPLPSTPRTPTSPFARPQSHASTSTITSFASSTTISNLSTTTTTSSTSTSTSATPAATSASTATTNTGMTLLLASTLTPKANRILSSTLKKASHKFSLTISDPSTSNALIQRSIHQNTVLFSNEGLTLLRLDRMYTLKLTLSSYSRLLSTGARAAEKRVALGKAMDELQLLVISQRGKGVAKAYLIRAYDHLPVSASALRDINKNYLAHFGSTGRPPITGVEAEVSLVVVVPGGGRSAREMPLRDMPLREVPVREVPLREMPLREMPLRETRGSTQSIETMRYSRGTYSRGPMTPNGWDDITPITRGEWNFFVADGLPKVGAVEAW